MRAGAAQHAVGGALQLQSQNVYARAIPPGGPPNLDVLGLELQRATDRVLGRSGAHVLFGSVIVN